MFDRRLRQIPLSGCSRQMFPQSMGTDPLPPNVRKTLYQYKNKSATIGALLKIFECTKNRFKKVKSLYSYKNIVLYAYFLIFGI